MEPSIYKPSIYNGAGIYNTGAEGGGGGSVSWYGNYKWNSNLSWSYNGQDKCFEQGLFDNGMGFGALRFWSEIDLSQAKKIEISLNVYLQHRTGMSSEEACIFDSQTISGVSDNLTRMLRVDFVAGTSQVNMLRFRVKTNTSWSAYYDVNIELPGNFLIKIIFDYDTKKFIYKVNDIEGEGDIYLNSPPSRFAPCYFMYTQNKSNALSYPFLWYYEKMFLSKTFLKADDVILYGLE